MGPGPWDGVRPGCDDGQRAGVEVLRTPMASDSGVTEPQRLRRVLGAQELGWLVDRIRIRLERGEPVDGTVTLVGATADQRRAAARLLGHAIGRGTSLSIPLPEVDAALRSRLAATGWHTAWLDEIVRDGSLTRLVRHGEGHVLAEATAVLERLPA